MAGNIPAQSFCSKVFLSWCQERWYLTAAFAARGSFYATRHTMERFAQNQQTGSNINQAISVDLS
jgi:hypothetical protein